MGVTNGQLANETNFNDAFLDKNVDTETVNKVALKRPASGADVNDVQQAVNDNKDNIASNDTDIAQNASDIAQNATDIGNNTSAINTNASNISTNASNISTNASDIDTIENDYGVANGLATLDAGGKVPASQLPSSVMEYKGNWDASTNTPTLADGVGNNGDVYKVSVAGTQDLGSGSITFAVGDWVIYNGAIWEKSDNSDAVTSVFTRTGAITAQSGDYNADQVDETNTRYFDIKNNHNALVDPTATDDSSLFYSVGSQWYNSVSGTLFICQDNTATSAVWAVATGSGGGGGGLDVFDTETFEDLPVADFVSSGNNASFLGGGTLDGSLSDETVSPISGSQSPKYTAGASSNNDYFEIKTVDIEEKQQGEWVGVVLYADTSLFSNDVTLVIYDKTNNAVITSALDLLKASTDKSRYAFSYVMPSNCNQISYGFHMNNGAVNTESFIFDDFEQTLNPFQYKEIARENVFSARVVGSSGAITSQNTQFISSVTRTGVGTYSIVFDTGFFSVIPSLTATAKIGSVSSITADYTSLTTSGATVRTYRTDTRALIDADLELVFQRQGDDYGKTTENIITAGNKGVEEYFAKTCVSARPSSASYGVSFTTEYINTLSDYASIVNDNTSGIVLTAKQPVEVETRTVFAENASSMQIGIVKNGDATIPLSSNPIADRHGEVSNGIGVTNTHSTATISLDRNETIVLVGASNGVLYTGGGNNFQYVKFTVRPKEIQQQGAIPVDKIAVFKDIRTSNSNGGDFSSGTQTRVLNTLTGDTSFCSLSSNQITLQAGKYEIEASAPAYKVDSHIARWYDVTGASYIDDLRGTTERSASGDSSITRSFIKGTLTVTSTNTYELRHEGQTTQLSSGFGTACGFGEDEVYSVVKIRKLR